MEKIGVLPIHPSSNSLTILELIDWFGLCLIARGICYDYVISIRIVLIRVRSMVHDVSYICDPNRFYKASRPKKTLGGLDLG